MIYTRKRDGAQFTSEAYQNVLYRGASALDFDLEVPTVASPADTSVPVEASVGAEASESLDTPVETVSASAETTVAAVDSMTPEASAKKRRRGR